MESKCKKLRAFYRSLYQVSTGSSDGKKWCRWIDRLHKTVTNGSWSEIRKALRIVIVQWSANTVVMSDNVDASKWNRHGVGILFRKVIATSYCHWHVVFSSYRLFEAPVTFTNSAKCNARPDWRQIQTALKNYHILCICNKNCQNAHFLH